MFFDDESGVFLRWTWGCIFQKTKDEQNSKSVLLVKNLTFWKMLSHLLFLKRLSFDLMFLRILFDLMFLKRLTFNE